VTAKPNKPQKRQSRCKIWTWEQKPKYYPLPWFSDKRSCHIFIESFKTKDVHHRTCAWELGGSQHVKDIWDLRFS